MWGYRFRTSVHSVFVRRNSWGIIFISINTSVVLWRCDSTVAQKNTKCKDNQNLCFDVRMCTFSNCKENSLGVISIITCSVLKRCHWTVAQKNMKCEENQNRCFNDRQCFEWHKKHHQGNPHDLEHPLYNNSAPSKVEHYTLYIQFRNIYTLPQQDQHDYRRKGVQQV